MEELIAGPLAAALERHRERCNALWAQAALRTPQLDPADLARLLRGPVQRCVAAVAAVAPERAEAVAIRLYESALHLLAQGHLGGGRNPVVAALWEEVLPHLALLVAAAPQRLTASLGNAAVNLWQEDRAAAGRWLQRLSEVAPRFDAVDTALDAALVLAWRAGLAHYRETALARWRHLPTAVQCAVLDLPASAATESVAAALAERWRPPHLVGRGGLPTLRFVATIGGFRGFGGPFAEPPLVTADGQGLIAYDGENAHGIWADCYGATLRRLAAVPAGCGTGDPGFIIDGTGTVVCGRLRAPFPPLAGASSYASTTETLAVTLPHSHAVYLIAAVAEASP